MPAPRPPAESHPAVSTASHELSIVEGPPSSRRTTEHANGSAGPRSIRGYAQPDAPDNQNDVGQQTKAKRSRKKTQVPPPGPLQPPPESEHKRKFWRRKLKFTREGKYFLGITLGVGFAAINTGNNLLYLLLGMMLSLIIVSGVMSELSLRNLTVKRRLPGRAQVGRSHLVEIEVFNDKARIPSYAIEVEAGQPADKRCFFLKISPHSTQIAAYRRTPLRRGLERHSGFRIATRFPFGLFEKSREVDSSDELIIYPAVDPVRLPPVRQGEASGDAGPLGRGFGDEIYALRAMRDGDDPRDIYWRKSTQPHQMVLRERAHEMRHEVELYIDVMRPGRLTTDDDASFEQRRDDSAHQFERRIRDVASHAVAHIKRGDRVTLSTNAGERVQSEASRGVDPLLRFLALLTQMDATATGAARRRPRRTREDAA